MATLNIKNFPAALYAKLRLRAKENRRSVAQEVTHILDAEVAGQGALSILDLKGLGAEHWHRIDATRHVPDERKAWD